MDFRGTLSVAKCNRNQNVNKRKDEEKERRKEKRRRKRKAVVLCFKPFSAWEVDGKRGPARGGSDRVGQNAGMVQVARTGRSPLTWWMLTERNSEKL